MPETTPAVVMNWDRIGEASKRKQEIKARIKQFRSDIHDDENMIKHGREIIQRHTYSMEDLQSKIAELEAENEKLDEFFQPFFEIFTKTLSSNKKDVNNA